MNRERHETSSKRNFRETQSDAQLQLSYTKRQQTDKKTQRNTKQVQGDAKKRCKMTQN